jgi:hypothetical protein
MRASANRREPKQMTLLKERYVIGTALFGVACFSLGISLGSSILGSAEGKNWIDFLAMLGGWVSGIGALVAVIAALKIADHQANHEHAQDAIRCTHHALAIINDLQGRLRALKIMLTDGGRPVLALSKNATAIERRYESLYDRDIYRHAPGDLVKLITNLSGTFFGLSVLVEETASAATQNGIAMLPPASDDKKNSLGKTFSSLEEELDALFSGFTEVRKNLDK